LFHTLSSTKKRNANNIISKPFRHFRNAWPFQLNIFCVRVYSTVFYEIQVLFLLCNFYYEKSGKLAKMRQIYSQWMYVIIHTLTDIHRRKLLADFILIMCMKCAYEWMKKYPVCLSICILYALCHGSSRDNTTYYALLKKLLRSTVTKGGEIWKSFL
jgi:hypothetical protein